MPEPTCGLPLTFAPTGDRLPEGPGGLVEIGLLIPSSQAAKLVELSRTRRESVGQILRELIRRELADDAVPSRPSVYSAMTTAPCRDTLPR